ncbi:MAG TPA: hypothetical protein V6C97_31245 [Oculatellaceae cyanobacterium]
MKFLQTLLIASILTITASHKANCQEFLKPVESTTPTFLEPVSATKPLPSTGSFATVTTTQSPQQPMYVSQLPPGQLPPEGSAWTSNNPVWTPVVPPTNPTPGVNGYGRYGNLMLPTVSTGAVNINTVDCPFIGANIGENNGWVYILGLGWRYLKEGPIEFWPPFGPVGPITGPVGPGGPIGRLPLGPGGSAAR